MSLRVQRGEIFAFLGPNGAGKTTTVEILEGFRQRTRRRGARTRRRSRARGPRVARADRDRPAGGPAQPELTVRETLALWSAYYPHPRPVDETIALAGLEEKADDRVGRLSGGQRRRLDVGLALDRRPRPRVPRRADDRLRPGRAPRGVEGHRRPARPRQDGLPDDALPRRGAGARRPRGDHQGRRDRRGGRAGRDSRAARRRPRSRSSRRPESRSATLPGGAAADVGADGRARLHTQMPTRLLAELCGWAAEQGIELERLEVTRPSLEDVYLELVERRRDGGDRRREATLRRALAQLQRRPQDLPPQPRGAVLHGDPAGDLPVPVRRDLRQRARSRNTAASARRRCRCRRSSRSP